MKVNARQLGSHLKSSLAPCYLVSGDEPLLVDEVLDQLRARARESGFQDRDVQVATAGFDWQALFDSGANLSLFSEKRMIELRLPTGKPGVKGSKAIVDLIDRLDAELMLIVITPRLDRKAASAKWVKALANAGAHVPVYSIDARELPGWIAQRMRAAGLDPDQGAVRLIAERVEGNLLAAQQEIEKLRLILGEGPVSAEQAGAAVADSSRFDVFKLADAALEGDASRAARILYGLQHEDVPIVIVIWSLARELRTLAALKQAVRDRGDLGRAMQQNGVWSSRQPMIRACLSRHSLEHIHALIVQAEQADAAAKGRLRGDAWQLAMNLVFGLAADGRRAA